MKDSLILKVVTDASTTTPAQPAQGPRWSSDPDPFYLKNYYKLYISFFVNFTPFEEKTRLAKLRQEDLEHQEAQDQEAKQLQEDSIPLPVA